MINRNDMLELTRRMTLARNCFSRIAGAYMDKEGYDDGTFNVHFGKLKPSEASRNLEIAKAVPFSETNVQLKEYEFAAGYCVEFYDDPTKYEKGTQDENYYCEIWIPVKKKA